MNFRNSPSAYGFISKILHWGLAVALWGMFLFGRHVANMKPALDNIHLYGWHKSIGILLLGIILFRLLWLVYSPAPKITAGSTRSKIKIYLAHSVHIGLYIMMLIVPLLGWLASSATGFEMRFFELFHIPSLISEDPALEKWLFGLHKISSAVLVALSILHLVAAFYHHLIDKDDTLRRMLP